MNICKFCNKQIKNLASFNRHEIKCNFIKDVSHQIIYDYCENFYSIKKLRKKYKLQDDDIYIILGNKKRTRSESSKLRKVLYPENIKHTEETKKILREKRLEFMKNNPDKTSWRQKNLSYPEKLFLNKIIEMGLDKKYLICREFSSFPYFVDFAFINELVAVEIDGSQHLLPERIESDLKKDLQLINNGWIVIRISENQIKTNINNVIENILEILQDRPKIDKITFGIITLSKNRPKKERNKYGLTKKQIESSIKQRKQERPNYDILKKQVEEMGYVRTSKIYNVSDNAIRKWLKFYEKSIF